MLKFFSSVSTLGQNSQIARLLFIFVTAPSLILVGNLLLTQTPSAEAVQLVQAATLNTEVIMLASQQEGFSQVSKFLATRPNLDDSGSPTLPAIDEDSSGGNGISLVDLVGNSITNTANGAEKGIAVTGLTGSGTWQYSLDDGSTWINLGPVSDANATVLPILYPRYPLYQGTTPGSPFSQGWVVRNPGSGVTETVNPSSTTMDSTSNDNLQDGYSSHAVLGTVFKWNSAYPDLNPVDGYTIRFEVEIESESHVSNDRAGFSIISVGSDTTKAIELGFWENEIWAQADSPLFTHAEGISYTTTANTIYDLTIQDTSYQLSANGTPILTNTLRDYTSWDSTGFPFDFYDTSSYLFLGDNTTSARASFTLSRLEILEKTRLRFVPGQDFNGQATLTYRAANPGNQVTIGQDATGDNYSLNTETASITINPLPDPKSLIYLPLIIRE